MCFVYMKNFKCKCRYCEICVTATYKHSSLYAVKRKKDDDDDDGQNVDNDEEERGGEKEEQEEHFSKIELN